MTLSTKVLVEQLRDLLTEDAAIAARAGSDAKDAAQHSVSAMEKRQDGRTMIEFANLAHAQSKRVERGRASAQALDDLLSRGLPQYSSGSPIGVGAIIDALAEDDDGPFGRTFVMLPVGAGEVLTGPQGDGIITVVTPQSPVGRAMMGKRQGDIAEVMVRGEPVDWEILDVAS